MSILCDLSIPPLTSVDVNAEQIGYTAAALLDQMMQGKRPLVSVAAIGAARDFYAAFDGYGGQR